MDRVGVEPTTSAYCILISFHNDGKIVQIPPAPSFFSPYAIALDLQGKFKEFSFSKNRTKLFSIFQK
jgi:hypothetical protein